MLRRVLVLLVLVCWAGQVRANYTEARAAGVDARVVIDRDGKMIVTHVLAYRVLAGTLRSIALVGFEDDLKFREAATVTSADGHTYGARVSRDDKDVVHVTVDDPKGIKRGDYKFEITYEGTLAGRVARDGAFDRIRFQLPPLHEGIDSERVVLDFPSAPTEPRALAEETEDATDIATLRRTADRDELELVRPHVAKSEAAKFFARVDPKAFALAFDPSLRAVAEPAIAMESPGDGAPIGVWIFVAAAALLVFAMGLAKSRVTSMAGFIPVNAAVRAALAAIFFGAGVRIQSASTRDDHLAFAAALVACAMPFLASRTPKKNDTSRSVRGPAAWHAAKFRDVASRVRTRSQLLDATTRRGALVVALLAIVVTVAAHLAAHHTNVSGAAYLVTIDALVLVPIFFTGTSLQLPPSPAREARALLPVARALRAHAMKATPFARMDEMRLLVVPETAMEGVTGIEVGVAWEGSGPWRASFDVIVRVTDGTFASSKMTAAFPTKRVLPGRKPDERVFRFEPEGPSNASCAEKVLELAEALRDRRVVIGGAKVDAEERRLPPNRLVGVQTHCTSARVLA